MATICEGVVLRTADNGLDFEDFLNNHFSCLRVRVLGTIAWWPWASYLHLCDSVAKQCRYRPRRVISLARKVTAELVKSNVRLPPAL